MIVSPEIYNAILALEYRYARLLDDDRLEEWPDLFVERGVYKVIPRENWHREPKLAILFCDSRAMMVDRISSLRTANIYNIHYPRHVVTNVEVLAARGDEYDVAAALHRLPNGSGGADEVVQCRSVSGRGHVRRRRTACSARKIAICDTFNIPNLLAIPL